MLGVAGRGELVFVVLVRIVSPDELRFSPDPGEVVVVVGVMGSGEAGVSVGTTGSGEAGVLVGTMGSGVVGVLVGIMGSGGAAVVVMIMGAGASGVLVGTGGCGGAGGSIVTVGSEPTGVLIIVTFVGEGAEMGGGKSVESIPGFGVLLDCIVGGGVGATAGGDGSGGVDGSGVGAESTRLRNSLGRPNQKLSTKQWKPPTTKAHV